MESPAFEDAPYIRMCLELLEALMRVEAGIEIVQSDHQADRYAAVRHVVDKAAAEFLVPERPSHRVNNAASGGLFLRHVPHFLDADRVYLRIAVFIQIE